MKYAVGNKVIVVIPAEEITVGYITTWPGITSAMKEYNYTMGIVVSIHASDKEVCGSRPADSKYKYPLYKVKIEEGEFYYPGAWLLPLTKENLRIVEFIRKVKK